MDSGERIYVVVPQKVTTAKGEINQPVGRQGAQACHAVGKLRYDMGKSGVPYRDITTIFLSARDSNEMTHVLCLLHKKGLTNYHIMRDTNPEYGDGAYIDTSFAICVKSAEEVTGILDYLPLFS